MDSNNGRPPQSDQPPPMDGGDWRTQLQNESRQRIVNKIMETLKRHLPFSGPEGLQELRKIAVRFEEKIYSAATSQSDYLRKISLKMLTMESKSQNTLPLPSTSGGGGVSRNSQDPVPAQNMQSQVHNQGQSVPLPMVPNQPQARQQLLPQKNIQNNLASSPAVSGLTQNPMSNITQNQNPQNTSSISQNSMVMLTNAQRQVQGWQQHMQPQQSQTPQQYMYSQQLQNQVMKQKLQSGNIQQSLGQTPLQQQQQNLLQHQQSVLRQQQLQNPSQPTSVAQQPQTQMSQKPLMLSQQQPNSVNIQQSQMIGQQSNISDMQQQRLLGQQNGVPNLPSQQQNNHKNLQQQLMGQQGNISNMHQQQSSHQAINGGLQQLQQQMQNGNSSMQMNLHSVHTMQQPKVAMQQSQSQQQLMPQLQTQLPQVQQHNMQQRIQNSNPLLQQQQQQGMIDHQKQLLQSQRAPQEAPSTSSDSTAQTGGGIANAGDWKEDVYQRIKVMKDSYLAELSEMYQKISMRLQQNESFPQQPKAEQLEKLRIFKTMLEKLIAFIQVQKNNVTPSHRDKLPSCEKQIISLLHSQNRPRKPGPSMQQSQMPSQSQFSQDQSLDAGAHLPLHSTIMQGSIASLHQNNVSNSQHSSVPSNIDSGQGNAPSSMQQVATESRQRNPASVPHQGNMASLQQNVNPQSNPNMLQNRHLKQHQDQMYQAQQLTHLQSRQLQQHILQKQLQQTKQQQATQMSQLGQMNDANELQMSQGLRSRSNGFPQHFTSAQRYAQQLKPGLETVSPQINQHSSPQIDEQNTQSANSPFVPSPSTPLASSLMPGEYEKPLVSSLTNTAKLGHQQISGPPTVPQPLSIGTPGMLASPLLKCPGADATHANATTTVSGKPIVTEQPVERLLKAVKSISLKALNASISDIGSVVSMIDRIAGSAPGSGSRATVGEDLVAMTNCRLQTRSSLTQDGNIGIKRIRRYTSAMPSYDDSLEQFTGFVMSEFESTSTSSIKKAKIEINHALVEEIREINDRLIDTVVDITDEDVDPLVATIGSEGTVIKCCFSAVSLSPNFKSQYTSALMLPIQPLRLLVPANYPSCSPILLDKLPVEVRKEYGDLSMKAKSRFNICLSSLSQPMSLREIARTWDNCARAVISEYAHHYGGGTFTSKYGTTWESCSTAA